MSGMPTALCTGALGSGIYRSHLLLRWTGHLAVATAVSHLLLLGALIGRNAPFGLEDLRVAGVPALLWAWILLSQSRCYELLMIAAAPADSDAMPMWSSPMTTPRLRRGG